MAITVYRRFFLAFAAAVSVLLSGCASAPPPMPLTGKDVARLGDAATVLVFCRTKADVSVPKFELDNDQIMALASQLQQARTGSNLDDPSVKQGFVNDLLTQFFSHLDTYCKVSAAETSTRVHVGSGSGWYVDDKGTVVTNAHVVAADATDFESDALDEALKNLLGALPVLSSSDDDIKAWLADPAHVQTVAEAVKTFAAGSTTVDNVAGEYDIVDTVDDAISQDDFVKFVQYLASDESQKPEMPFKQAKLLRNGVGERTPGPDVALLRVDPGQDFSLVPADRNPEIQDDVIIVGYPGNLTEMTSDTTQNTTSGKITKLGTSVKGVKFLFFDASTAQGNSGGPVLDKDGKVIALATIGTPGDNNTTIAGENGGVAVSEVRPFLAKAEVAPKETKLTGDLRKVLSLMDAKRYRDATPILDSLIALKPNSTVLKSLKDDAQSAIAAGQDRTPNPLMPVIAAVVLIVVVVVAAGLMRARIAKSSIASRPESKPVPPPDSKSLPLTPASLPGGTAAETARTLTIAGVRLPLTPGRVFTGKDLRLSSGSPNAIFAEVVPKPGSDNEFGLKNRSAEAWSATVSGRTSQIAPGSSVRIQPGLQLTIAGQTAQIE